MAAPPLAALKSLCGLREERTKTHWSPLIPPLALIQSNSLSLEVLSLRRGPFLLFFCFFFSAELTLLVICPIRTVWQSHWQFLSGCVNQHSGQHCRLCAPARGLRFAWNAPLHWNPAWPLIMELIINFPIISVKLCLSISPCEVVCYFVKPPF